MSRTLYKIIQCIQKDSPDFEFDIKDSEDPGTFEIYSNGALIYSRLQEINTIMNSVPAVDITSYATGIANLSDKRNVTKKQCAK